MTGDPGRGGATTTSHGVLVRGVRVPEALLADVRVVVPHHIVPGVARQVSPEAARRYAEEIGSVVAQTAIVSVVRVDVHEHYAALSITTEAADVADVVDVVTRHLEGSPHPPEVEAMPAAPGPDELADSAACEVLLSALESDADGVPRPFVLVTSPDETSAWPWPVLEHKSIGRRRPRGHRMHTFCVAGAQQVVVRLIRLAPSWTAPELAVIRVFTHLWGATPSSPLFAAMRTSGLAYAPSAGIALSPFPRWWVSFSCSPGTAERAVAALRRAVQDGARSVPRDSSSWEEAVTVYEHAAAMGRLHHEATMQRLVDRALADAPPTDDVTALREVSPGLAHRTWVAFLDLAEMDLVAVTPPEATFSADFDTASPDGGEDERS